ncbi:hypothetical protein ACRAVF_00300 [Bradyrhizobium oligotrophicum S58]
MFSVKTKEEYFSPHDWTRVMHLKTRANSSPARTSNRLERQRPGSAFWAEDPRETGADPAGRFCDLCKMYL